MTMNKVFFGSVLVAALGCFSGVAMADEAVVVSQTPDAQTAQNNADVAKAQADVNKGAADAKSDPVDHFRVGMTVDASFPAGLAVGIQERLPYLPSFKISESFTYTLAPGARLRLLVDPIKFGIAPVLNADIGWQSQFNIPGFHNPPAIEWTYETLGGGLALGNRDGFRFLLLVGMTHFNGTVSHIDGVLPTTNGIVISNPTINAWTPSGGLGVEWLF
jgi:hypothetical protein